MITITKQQLEFMKSHIVDVETGMTEFDLFEFEHAYEDWNIIDNN